MCSADLRSWMAEWHLDLTLGVEGDGPAAVFNPREAFGSHSDSDHVYNTPRAWYMQRCLNPSDVWDGPEADYTPESDDIPWSRVPERKVTIEDIKYVLSSHYQGTEYDCYGSKARPPRAAPIVPSASTATVSSPCCNCAPMHGRRIAPYSGWPLALTRLTRSCRCTPMSRPCPSTMPTRRPA